MVAMPERADSGNVAESKGQHDSSLKEAASAVGQKVGELGQQAREAAAEKLGEIREQAQEKASEWKHSLEEFIREKPLQSILIAAGLGAALTILCKRI